MDPKGRVETLAKSKVSHMSEKTSGEATSAPGARFIVDPAEVAQIIEHWPAAPKKIAAETVDRYGPPNEATPTLLIWHDNGPWKRTEITADERPHKFPTPHTDYIAQFINYDVPVEKFNDIARFDGSVVPNRTTGEVFAACDMEAMNVLSLNLMHEIVTGQRTVEQARRQYAESASAYMLNRLDRYTERLLFEPPPAGQTGDEDETVIGPSMVSQTKEKAKDVLGLNDE